MFGSIISSIISGVLSPLTGVLGTWLKGKNDIALQQVMVNGQVDQGLLNAYIAQLNARRDLLVATQAHFAGRMMQYIFVYPLGFWWTSIIVYCIVKPWVPWWQPVLALPDNILPWGAGITAFLFLGSKIDGWVRK